MNEQELEQLIFETMNSYIGEYKGNFRDIAGRIAKIISGNFLLVDKEKLRVLAESIKKEIFTPSDEIGQDGK